MLTAKVARMPRAFSPSSDCRSRARFSMRSRRAGLAQFRECAFVAAGRLAQLLANESERQRMRADILDQFLGYAHLLLAWQAEAREQPQRVLLTQNLERSSVKPSAGRLSRVVLACAGGTRRPPVLEHLGAPIERRQLRDVVEHPEIGLGTETVFQLRA